MSVSELPMALPSVWSSKEVTYHIYRDGVEVGTTTTLSFEEDLPTEPGTYVYTITAEVDGVESNFGEPYTVVVTVRPTQSFLWDGIDWVSADDAFIWSGSDWRPFREFQLYDGSQWVWS